MAQKKKANDDYKIIDAAIKAGQVGSFYIFHGEEHYLRDRYLQSLRKHLCPDGLGGFNYKRFEGKDITPDSLEDAVDTLPVFAERTLIEIHDFELFPKRKQDGEEQQEEKKPKRKESKSGPPPLLRMLSALPDYVCLLFVYDTLTYKPDSRVKINKEILKHAQVIEFCVQDQKNLVKWMMSHYRSLGKSIKASDAEHLIHITGGLMSTLKSEIEKTVAYSKNETVSRSDIDAVVIPELDAVVYQLTDSLVKREHVKAMHILDELLRMREAPHRLMFSISLKMRQLLAARVCIEDGLGKNDLMKMCAIMFDFQAKMLLDTARKSTLTACRDAVLNCAKAAYDLNSSPDPESRLVELITQLAFAR